MKIINLFKDYEIPYITEGKNVSPGWIVITCPFCDDPSEHLGYNLRKNYFHCWRCGWKSSEKVLTKLLKISLQKAKEIISEYGGSESVKEKSDDRKLEFNFPSLTTKMNEKHRMYLERRNFDPDKIEREWKIMGTGPISSLDNIDYKFRIIAPIYWRNNIVSFQSRDITEKSPYRYKVCPPNREIIFHKTIIYKAPNVFPEIGICVEGITDVWRLGANAFATFGTKYTIKQIEIISKLYKKVFIIFDNEEPAQIQANKLLDELNFSKVKANILTVEDDPASMKQDDANYLVKELLK